MSSSSGEPLFTTRANPRRLCCDGRDGLRQFSELFHGPGPNPWAVVGAYLSVDRALRFELADDARSFLDRGHIGGESQRGQLVRPPSLLEHLNSSDQPSPLEPYRQPRAVPASQPEFFPDLALKNTILPPLDNEFVDPRGEVDELLLRPLHGLRWGKVGFLLSLGGLALGGFLALFLQSDPLTSCRIT